MPGRLPDFLIVGAMKAGTTSLWADLARTPGICLPPQKEPETLVRHAGDAAAARADWADLFRGVPAGVLTGEASTAYTKRPDLPDVAQLARRVAGDRLRIVYLTRDPVARMVSQWRHERSLDPALPPFEIAVRRDPAYVAWSRYDWQIAPWKAAFPGAVLTLALEDYLADPAATRARVLAHIGHPGGAAVTAGPPPRANATGERRVVRARLGRRLIASPVYQRRVKPLLGAPARALLRRLVPVSAAPEVAVPPDLRRELMERLGHG